MSEFSRIVNGVQRQEQIQGTDISSGAATSGYVLTANGAGGSAFTSSGSGSVTSVALTVPSIFNVSGSPITTSGTFAVTLANESANLVFAGPTIGSATTPTFRSLVGADLPNPSATTLGGIESYASVAHQWINAISTSGVPSSTQPAFSDISGTLGISQGGTGQTTASAAFGALSPLTTAGDLLYYSTVNARLALGTSNQVLTSNGSTLVWGAVTLSSSSAVTGALAIANGGSGQTTASAALAALSGFTTAGDISYATSGVATTRLGIGSGFNVLTVSNITGLPIWSTVNLSAGNAVSGILGISNGGTGQSTASAAFNALAPTTTAGDTIYYASGTNNRLAIGTSNQVMVINGSDLPSWGAVTLSNSSAVTGTLAVVNGGTGATTASANTIFAGPTSGSAAAPAFRSLVGADLPNPSATTLGGVESYTAVSNQFLTSISTSGVPVSAQPSFSNISSTVSSSQVTTSTFIAPKITVYTSGSGTFTTSTSPRGPVYVTVEMIGGGSGGSGSSTSGGTQSGSNAGNTTFGGSTAGGGSGQTNGASFGGAGGTNTLGSGHTALVNQAGSYGMGTTMITSGGVYAAGGIGGHSPYGGAGISSTNSAGTNAVANSGSGGGGGGASATSGVYTGCGGGSGGYLKFVILSSIASTYSFAVGSGGAGGAAGAGGNAGGNGASGIIIVTEHYQ